MKYFEEKRRGIVMSRCGYTVWLYSEWERYAFKVICDYLAMLLEWRCIYAVTDRHYAESLCFFPYGKFVFERFIKGGQAERIKLGKEVERFEERICEYRREHISCVAYGKGKDKRSLVL